MLDSSLLTVLTGAGVAGIFCILFLIGWVYPKSVVDDLKAERDYERQRADSQAERADAAVAAVQATTNVLGALQAGAALGSGHRRIRGQS